MKCRWCATDNPPGKARCAGCGRQLVALDPGSTRSSPTEPTQQEPLETTAPVWAPPTATGFVPPPPAALADTEVLPTTPGGPPTPVEREADDRDDRRGQRNARLIGALAAVALLVACLGVLFTVLASDDDSEGSSTSVPTTSATATTIEPPPTTTAATTTAPPETSAPTTTAPATTTTELATTTAAPATTTTAPATTTTEPATTTTAPATTTASTVPSNTGANVLDDPLPSGLSAAEVAPSLEAAQTLASALADGDWDTVRQIDPGFGDLSDADLEDGFGPLDRATLLLVDATRTDQGDDLVVVLIANEFGTQTSLYCSETTVRSDGAVNQRAATLLDRFSGTLGIEDIRDDQAIVQTIRQQCTA